MIGRLSNWVVLLLVVALLLDAVSRFISRGVTGTVLSAPPPPPAVSGLTYGSPNVAVAAYSITGGAYVLFADGHAEPVTLPAPSSSTLPGDLITVTNSKSDPNKAKGSSGVAVGILQSDQGTFWVYSSGMYRDPGSPYNRPPIAPRGVVFYQGPLTGSGGSLVVNTNVNPVPPQQGSFTTIGQNTGGSWSATR